MYKDKKDFALLRHVLKTISYRILGTLITIMTALYLGVSFEVSAFLGVGELLIKPLVYFIHERVWYKYVKIKR
jgi:uncharacterized membrane protein